MKWPYRVEDEQTYSIDSRQCRQLASDIVGLLETGEIALQPFDPVAITPFGQLLLRIFGVIFLIGQEVELLRVVLENVRANTETYACTATRHNIYLHECQMATLS